MATTDRKVAAQKAAITRKAKKAVQEKKWRDAGKKSWETRRYNLLVKAQKLAAKRAAKNKWTI